MRARCLRSLIWGSPALLLLGLLVVGGQRGAAASELRLAAADAGVSAEVADFLAYDEAQTAAGEAKETDAKASAYGGKGCTTNAQCPKKNYCAKAAGECKGKGECKVKPELCPDIFKPVCGCDGKTYSNECVASAAGVNVKADGACEKAVKCKTNAQCGKLQFCVKPTGKCDDEGVCAPRPINVFCKKTDPVCGCDDKTYDGQCFAHKAGVDVKHAGKCET